MLMTEPIVGAPGSTGLAPNVAAALSYLLGVITGVIFFVLDKDNRFVRFHAMQSILVSALFIVLSILLGILASVPVLGWILALFAYPLLGIVGFICWLLLMYKAFNGQEWEFPVLGKYARQYSGDAAAL
jgi:uncharacterized membrane protein